MSPRKWVGVFVRSVGLLMCLYGAYLLIAGVWDVLVVAVFVHIGEVSLLNFSLRTLVPVAGYFAGGVLILRNAERTVRFAYPHRAGFCDQCGYDLRGSPERCPECGTAPPS